MNIIDVVTVVALLVVALIGFFSGFGRSLRHFSGGIIGIILSIFVCAACGGLLLGTELIGGWVAQLNIRLGEVAAFFAKIHAGVIVFYIAMFFAVQLLRIIVIKLISGIFEADNNVMKVINKVLGMVFAPSVLIIFGMLVLAVFKLFDDTTAVGNLLMKIDGTLIYKIYQSNPIVLHV